MAEGMPTRQKIRLGLIGLGVILLVIVILQNTESTPTHLLFITITMPRAVLLFVTLALGFLAGLFAGGRFRRK